MLPTPRTLSSTRTRLAAASLFIGTTLSIALAMVGPVVLPQPGHGWHSFPGAGKTVSWLTTVYSDLYPDRALTPAAQVAKTRNRPYIDDVQLLRLDSLASQPAPFSGECNIMESGFPCRSFDAWSIRLIDRSAAAEHPPVSSGVLALRSAKSDPLEARWIPLNPLWPGLLANAAVWSFAIALPLFAWAEGRRALRRRRNRCVNCGYSRAGLDPASPCPECGKA